MYGDKTDFQVAREVLHYISIFPQLIPPEGPSLETSKSILFYRLSSESIV